MKRILLSLLFLQMMGGMKAQSLDEDLQWSVQAEEIKHYPKDSVLYAGVIVIYKDRQFAVFFLPYEGPEPKYIVGIYIWKGKGYANLSDMDWTAFNSHIKPLSDSQNIKHSVDWVHPAER